MKNVFHFHENNIIMQQINLKMVLKISICSFMQIYFFLFIMESLKYDLAMISPSCPCNAHIFHVFVALLTFLAHSSSSSCRTDAGEVIVLLLTGSTVTAGLGVTWPVAVDHQSVLQRDCGHGGLRWSGGGW